MRFISSFENYYRLRPAIKLQKLNEACELKRLIILNFMARLCKVAVFIQNCTKYCQKPYGCWWCSQAISQAICTIEKIKDEQTAAGGLYGEL